METLPAAGMDAGKLLAGAAVGAVLMYLFDPERGAPRRAGSAQRLREFGRQAGSMASHLATGVASETTRQLTGGSAGTRHHRSADHGGSFHHARALDQPPPLADSALPAPLHGRARHGMRKAAMAGGGLLALYGLVTPRSTLAAALGLAGLALAAGSAGPGSRRLMARASSHARPVVIEKTIRIGAPAEQVYELFANYDNFPRFLSNVRDVRDLGNNRSRWVVTGPGGAEFTWNSVLTEHRRPHRLAWESEPGAEVEQHGSIDFEPFRDSTRVTLRLSYRPPAGRVGHALATLLGSDPGRQLDADLQRMKQMVERGELHQLQRAATDGTRQTLH